MTSSKPSLPDALATSGSLHGSSYDCMVMMGLPVCEVFLVAGHRRNVRTLPCYSMHLLGRVASCQLHQRPVKL